MINDYAAYYFPSYRYLLGLSGSRPVGQVISYLFLIICVDKLCFLFCRLFLSFGLLFSPGGSLCFTWNLRFSTLPDVFLVSNSMYPCFLPFYVPFVLLFDREGGISAFCRSCCLLALFHMKHFGFFYIWLSYFVSLLVLSSYVFLFGYLPRKLIAFIPFPCCFPFSLLDSFRFSALILPFRRVGDTVFSDLSFPFSSFRLFYSYFLAVFQISVLSDGCFFLFFLIYFLIFCPNDLIFYFSFLSVLFFLYFTFNFCFLFYIFPSTWFDFLVFLSLYAVRFSCLIVLSCCCSFSTMFWSCCLSFLRYYSFLLPVFSFFVCLFLSVLLFCVCFSFFIHISPIVLSQYFLSVRLFHAVCSFFYFLSVYISFMHSFFCCFYTRTFVLLYMFYDVFSCLRPFWSFFSFFFRMLFRFCYRFLFSCKL